MYNFFLEGIQGEGYQVVHILLVLVSLTLFLNGIMKLIKANKNKESVYSLNEKYAVLMAEKGMDEETIKRRLKLRYKFQSVIGLILAIGLIIFKNKFYPLITPITIITLIIVIFLEKSS